MNKRAEISEFWRPPSWKWGLVLLLLACVATLHFWKRSVGVELLPFPKSRPTWDGSYPYLTISLAYAGSGAVKFDSSFSLIQPTVRHDSVANEFQVDLHSGMFVLRQIDLYILDITPLFLTRTYRTWDFRNRAFGKGTNHPYDICPTGTRFPYTYMDLNLEDGRQIHFRRISKGTGYADAVFGHEATSSEFYGARILWNGDGWTLQFLDGRRFLFPEAYAAKNFAQGAAYEMRDATGHRIQLKRDRERNLNLLISPSGRRITFKYDDGGRIVEAIDDAGNVRKYCYDSSGHLETVGNGSRILYRFEYARFMNYTGYDAYLMTAIQDGGGRVLLRNIYLDGRISEQKLLDGEMYRYKYILAGNQIRETVVDGPQGEKKLFFQHGVLTGQEWRVIR